MKLQRMDSEKQCKLQHYEYNLRFRHQYEAEIQPSMKKNHNERSKLKDHENIKVQTFIIDTIWRCVDSRKKEEEKDIEVVMEEPLMRYNSCTSKQYKKKEIVRVDDVLIKNVSISNLDNVLWNSIEKQYRVNKDFVRLSDKLESDIGPDDF
ncbi:MAG: hypothetical protein EZS28_016480 [Streblomastix strix]|uniref:Uncharacterized protein n=1 Tax=Streblomastix strix TaxID=222440 RepID=A0A5J4VZK5_9EUKA|nr:MAG: hypothetical protein EZS28_016480 [Streblomastix strix]